MNFHVITISNDVAQYDAMRRSFEDAGFAGAGVRFTRLDNADGNRFEPYDVLRTIDETGDEPIVIFCHQDVRLDLGDGRAKLTAIVERMNARDPRWALLGNSGGDRRGEIVRHLNDPHGHARAEALPRRVLSLDENFLIVRRGAGPLASDGLAGFHLYGTDACLIAATRGRTSYVVPFLLTHLSQGHPKSADFAEARARFVDAWRPRVLLLIVQTTCTFLMIGAWPITDRAAKNKLFRNVAERIGLTFVRLPARWRRAAPSPKLRGTP